MNTLYPCVVLGESCIILCTSKLRFLVVSIVFSVFAPAALGDDAKAVEQIDAPTVTLSFENIELRTILSNLADQADLNVVVVDSVIGSVTVRFDETPWEEAMDAILAANGLSSRLSGNIIYIAPEAKIVADEIGRLEHQAKLAGLGYVERAETFTGEKLTLKFADIETRAVLQLIAETAKKNIVVSDTVQGNITMRLENVPWDQALDLILKTKGLAKREVENTILITPEAEIRAYEISRLEHQKELAKLGFEEKAKTYTGQRLTLNFQDIEARAVLQMIAETSGRNIVVSDTVVGNISIRLQNVPWDQALDLILRTKGLDKREIHDDIYVAPIEEMRL